MGVYVITGGSGGIGGKTAELARAEGHTVINIDLKSSDICENLGTPEGRQHVIDELHNRCADGIDALICTAGVSGTCPDLKLIASLNYFGSVEIALGVYDLLKKKHGSCVITSSNTISRGIPRMDLVNMMNNYPKEERILKLVEVLDASSLPVRHSIYTATKYSLARWVRRISSSWGANGVRINAVAPGNVRSPMTEALASSKEASAALAALPIPTRYGQGNLMEPDEIAEVNLFLASRHACGINGNVVFVDGGTDALLNSEKVY